MSLPATEDVASVRDGQPSFGGMAESRQHNGMLSRCPRCGVFVQNEYLVCPYCALALKKECPRCHRQIPLNWNACSFCGNVLVSIVPPNSEGLCVEVLTHSDNRPVQATISGKVMLRGRCPQCARLVMDDARFCDGCGWKVEDLFLRPIAADKKAEGV